MYNLAIATHFKDFLRVFMLHERKRLKNTKKMNILPFIVFFLCAHPKNIFSKGKNMHILAIATHF